MVSPGSNRCLTVRADIHRQYQISLVENLLQSEMNKLAECMDSREALIVTTPTVAKLYGSALQRELRSLGFSVPMLVIRCTEQSKTMRKVEHICSQAYAYGLGRKSVVIGIGGGVCTDLVTMAASLIRRGIGHIRIPTTLLGQVDAAIGIKGAVNTAKKKSAMGCFYAPESVFIDPSFIRTLPLEHISDGLAEIIKVALVCDNKLFDALERHISPLIESRFDSPQGESRSLIWCSIERMIEQLSCGLYEDSDYQRLMDFGHTFSPALEAQSEFRLSHGQAVAIDMAMTLALAKQLGWLTSEDRDRALSVIVASLLPISSELLTEELCMTSFRETTAHRAGALNLVLPTGLGCASFLKYAEQIHISMVRSALAELDVFERRVIGPRPPTTVVIADRAVLRGRRIAPTSSAR